MFDAFEFVWFDALFVGLLSGVPLALGLLLVGLGTRVSLSPFT